MVDGDQHMNNSKVHLIVRAVITKQDHILLSTSTSSNREFAQGLYFLPGGHVIHGESAIEALQRELMEEMNLKAQTISFAGALECSWNRQGSIYHELNLLFKAEFPQLSLNEPPQSSEHQIKFVWCPLSNLSDYAILPRELTPMIQQTLRDQTRGCFYSDMLDR